MLVGPASSLLGRADEGEVLGAGDVVGAAAVQVAVGVGFFVELEAESPSRSISVEDLLVFGFGAVAIDDAIGPGELGRVVYPIFQWSAQADSP